MIDSNTGFADDPSGMRLHAVRDGTLYATRGQELLAGANVHSLRQIGRLPARSDLVDGVESIIAHRPVEALIEKIVGRYATHTVYPVDSNNIIATSGCWMMTTDDGGTNWKINNILPPSSPRFGVLPSAICVHDGTIYVGEYQLEYDRPARLLRSTDNGQTWTGFDIAPARHIHGVQVDPYSGELWITTGDTDVESRILRFDDESFSVVGGGSQAWRAVELAFTEDAILWGMDCAYATSKPIYRLDRQWIDDGTPMKVSEVAGSVYYSATLQQDDVTWVAFSSAIEQGIDSTAPHQQVKTAQKASVVAASEESAFTEWYELAGYRKRRVLGELLPNGVVPIANAYVFLESTADEFILNPFNTASHDSQLRQIKPPY